MHMWLIIIQRSVDPGEPSTNSYIHKTTHTLKAWGTSWNRAKWLKGSEDEETFCEVVSPRNDRKESYTHVIFQQYGCLNKLNNDNINAYGYTEGRLSWGTTPKHWTTGRWWLLRVGELAFPGWATQSFI